MVRIVPGPLVFVSQAQLIVILRLTFQSSPMYIPKKSLTGIRCRSADHLRGVVERAK